MSVIPKIPRASGGKAPLAPYQASTLDQLGTLSGPQTPRLLTPPLTTNPGSAPDNNSLNESHNLAIPNYIIPIKKGKKKEKNNFILYDPAINIHIISYLLTKKKKRKGKIFFVLFVLFCY